MEKETRSRQNEEIALRSVIINYLLHWKLIIGTGLVAVLLGVLYLVFYPKTYETMARVQIQNENDMLSSGTLGLGGAAGLMQSFGLGGISAGSIVIDDEIGTFTSNSLLSEMVHRLGLFAEYSEPFSFGYRLYGDEPLKVTADSMTIARLENEIKCKVSVSPNHVKIKVKIKSENIKKTFEFSSLPAVVSLKQGDFTFSHTDIGRNKGDYSLNVKIRPLNAVADDLNTDFTIEELSKISNIIEFVATDYKKQRTKDMFNTLIELYNIRAVKYRKDLGDVSILFLNNRIETILKDLGDVERAIEEYKTQNRLTIVETDVQFYAEYMRDLQAKLIEAETQSHIIRLLDTFVKDSVNRYKLVPSLLTAANDSEGSPLALYNQALLERERIINNSSKDNPMVAPLSLQIDKLRESVYQMVENASQSAALSIRELKAKEKAIMSKMGDVPQQERVYIDYKRQQEILQGVYLILLQKREEIALTIGQAKEKAKIIDPAFNKPLPVAPRKLFAAIGVIIFTLFVTIGWLFAKEQFIAFKDDFYRIKNEKE